MRNLIKNILLRLGLRVQLVRNNPKLDLYLKIYGEEPVRNRRFYNIGQSVFFHPAWTIIDYFKDKLPGPYALHHDLMSLKPLPVEDAKAQLVYTSHTLEHISNEAAAFLLKDIFRILKPGGIVRIVTPDIRLSYRAWKENDVDFFFWIKDAYMDGSWEKYNLRIPLNRASLTQVFLEDFAATASEITITGAKERISDEEMHRIFSTMKLEEALDYCISRCPAELQQRFPFHHMNWFTEEKLTGMLREAGFKTVYASRYAQSRSPVMRDIQYFDTTAIPVSLYMEAIR